MSETSQRTVGRRRLLKTSALALAGGAALGGGGAGAVAAKSQSGTDLTEWFGNVSNVDGVVDETGASAVTLTVGASGNNGAFAFDPAAVRVDPGTTVTWEWTGEGGQHNVVAAGDSEGAFESDTYGSAGETFEHTFEEEGVFTYVCVPHEAMGMKGAVIVGDQEVTVPSGGGGGGGGDGSDGGEDGEERTYLSREPDYDGWFDDVDNYEGTVDARGRDEVRITVGAAGNGGDLAFDPPAVAVDPGTRVIWEWAGEDGPHRFVAEDGDYESPEQASGQYGLEFDGVGISRFACEPHRDAGMKGAVVVGDPYETVYDVGTSELLVGGTFAAGLLSPLGFAAAVWLRERLGGDPVDADDRTGGTPRRGRGAD